MCFSINFNNIHKPFILLNQYKFILTKNRKKPTQKSTEWRKEVVKTRHCGLLKLTAKLDDINFSKIHIWADFTPYNFRVQPYFAIISHEKNVVFEWNGSNLELLL